MLIPNKREFLARRLRDLGVLRLLERFARRPCLLVVTHHRIGDPATNPFYDPVFSASPAAFEAQMRYLCERFRLLRLDELLTIAESGFAISEPSVLVTFDDGYRDNFDVAFPILKALGIPATFFLPTGFIGRPRLPWWDRISYVIKQTRQTNLVLDFPEPMTIDLKATPLPDAIWLVIRTFMNDPLVDEAAFLAHLEERARVAVDGESLSRDLFMTWDQVREVAEAGITIGSHSHNHPNLGRLPEAEQLRELTDSKRILEQELGREITALAYPFGEAGAFSTLTKTLANKAGYHLAFSARRGPNWPGRTDPFDIRRIGIGVSDTPSQFRARVVLYATVGSSII